MLYLETCLPAGKVKNYRIKNCRNRGFSMMEVIMSIAVLSIGIVGVMSLLVSSMSHSMDSRDTIIATELVQEGLELVRNVQDNNVASGATDFTNFTTNSNNYRIDKTYSSGAIDSNISPPADYFKLKYNNNFYEHTTAGSATKFQRRITVADYDVPSGGPIEGKIIISVVTWGGIIPPDSPSASNCNVVSKCTFAQSILVAR